MSDIFNKIQQYIKEENEIHYFIFDKDKIDKINNNSYIVTLIKSEYNSDINKEFESELEVEINLYDDGTIDNVYDKDNKKDITEDIPENSLEDISIEVDEFNKKLLKDKKEKREEMSIFKETEKYLPEGEDELQSIEESIISMWRVFNDTKNAIIAHLEDVGEEDRVDDFSRKYIDPLEDAINKLDNETEKEPFGIKKTEEEGETETETDEEEEEIIDLDSIETEE